MSASLHIAVSQESGKVPVTMLVLNGSLDASTHGDLEEKAMEIIDGGARNLLLDLSSVSYMGSAGLRAFHIISNRLKETEPAGKIKLVNPSEAVSKVMKTLGFDSFFDVQKSIDEAINSF